MSELKQSVSDAKLMQMMSENFTVSHLVASSINVSTLERYIQIFDKIFSNLNGDIRVGVLLGKKIAGGEPLLSKIVAAYDFRNTLVHEIGIGVVGHPNIRDWHSFSDAIEIGESILLAMQDIEANITANAPTSFPNLLDDDFCPIDEVQKLNKDICDIEMEIESAIKAGLTPDALTVDLWKSLVASARSAREIEIEHISRLDLAGARYYDVRPFIIVSILNQRIVYLKLYRKEIAG